MFRFISFNYIQFHFICTRLCRSRIYMTFSPNLQFYVLLTLNAFLIGTKMLMEICNEWKAIEQVGLTYKRSHYTTAARCNVMQFEEEKKYSRMKRKNPKRTRQSRMKKNIECVWCILYYWSIFTHTVCSVLNCHWAAKYIAYYYVMYV